MLWFFSGLYTWHVEIINKPNSNTVLPDIAIQHHNVLAFTGIDQLASAKILITFCHQKRAAQNPTLLCEGALWSKVCVTVEVK